MLTIKGKEERVFPLYFYLFFGPGEGEGNGDHDLKMSAKCSLKMLIE